MITTDPFENEASFSKEISDGREAKLVKLKEVLVSFPLVDNMKETRSRETTDTLAAMAEGRDLEGKLGSVLQGLKTSPPMLTFIPLFRETRGKREMGEERVR